MRQEFQNVGKYKCLLSMEVVCHLPRAKRPLDLSVSDLSSIFSHGPRLTFDLWVLCAAELWFFGSVYSTEFVPGTGPRSQPSLDLPRPIHLDTLEDVHYW